MDDRDLWGMIDARPIVFPARAYEVSMAMLHHHVPADLLRTVVTEDPFSFVVDADGTVVVTLLLADYRRAEWGPSSYAGLTVPVHAVGGGPPAIRLCRGVTNAAFTDEVLYWALGVSGALGELAVTYRPGEATVELGPGGSELFVRLPRPPGPPGGPAIETDVYTCDGDVPRQVPYELDAPVLPVSPADVTVEAGSGPLADAVLALDLTRPAARCGWGEQLTMSIHRPRPLAGPFGPPSCEPPRP